MSYSTFPRLGTLKEARAYVITPYVYGIIIGVIISDGHLGYPSKAHKNARL